MARAGVNASHIIQAAESILADGVLSSYRDRMNRMAI